MSAWTAQTAQTVSEELRNSNLNTTREQKLGVFFSPGVGVGLNIKVYDSDYRNQASQFGWVCH